jgi:hypothetical protein
VVDRTPKPEETPLESPCEVLPLCPICATNEMKIAHRHKELVICVCLHCGTTLSVPTEALTKMSLRVEKVSPKVSTGADSRDSL